MPEPKKVPWVTVIIVCAGIGTLCWGFMYPVDVILEVKQKRGIQTCLPRTSIPVVVATIGVIGAVILFMIRKGVLPDNAAEKMITLMMTLFVGYGALEIFTGGGRPHEVINPSASTGSNSVVALRAERRQPPPTDAE